MLREIAVPIESLAAIFAPEWPFPSMNSNVHREIALPFESLVAVCLHVPFYVIFRLESFITLHAREWSFVAVCPHVHFHGTLPLESPVTLHPCEWLIFAVCLHVTFHFTLAAEMFAALCACECLSPSAATSSPSRSWTASGASPL